MALSHCWSIWFKTSFSSLPNSIPICQKCVMQVIPVECIIPLLIWSIFYEYGCDLKDTQNYHSMPFNNYDAKFKHSHTLICYQMLINGKFWRNVKLFHNVIEILIISYNYCLYNSYLQRKGIYAIWYYFSEWCYLSEKMELL